MPNYTEIKPVTQFREVLVHADQELACVEVSLDIGILPIKGMTMDF
jgi:hypothetical protein